MKNSTNNKLAGTGILTAVAASLCCITPVLAIFSGVTGVASAFSWIEPVRPYLVAITVLVLGYAWYQKLKPQKVEDVQCDCETGQPSGFLQRKLFLGLITIFAVLMLTFPYYSSVFYPDNKKEVVFINPADVVTLNLDIQGMTCKACNFDITHAAQDVNGGIEAHADYKSGKATVKYDGSLTNKEAVVNSINATGYRVVSEKFHQ